MCTQKKVWFGDVYVKPVAVSVAADSKVTHLISQSPAEYDW